MAVAGVSVSAFVPREFDKLYFAAFDEEIAKIFLCCGV